jgi:hypothetical protein
MRNVRSLLTVAAAVAIAAGPVVASGPAVALPSSPHAALDCTRAVCPDVSLSDEVFGHYVGHDEPSTVFYSNSPGAGNQAQYTLTLPTDPPAQNPQAPGKSFEFQLNGAFWFGMAMCDTQSYPEQVSTCPRDSDKNILDPSISPNHAGSAFTELQFYPPGWVKWPVFQTAIGAGSCDPTKWCAAVNIFGLLRNATTGQNQNSTCAAQVGIEDVNFAFVTKNGKTQAPANPVQSTVTTFTPDPHKDLFMNSGDKIVVTMHDTNHGLGVVLNDLTTLQTGSMVASAANGFGQVKFDPTGTSCTNLPYDFHPMYSTSSENTRVIWAVHTYNVDFTSEIGHMDFCNGPNPIPPSMSGAACPSGNTEETGANAEPTDSDATTCFPASMSSRVQIAGCTDTNTGFDGYDYQPIWPDGNTKLHPTSVMFTSPRTGPTFNTQYSRVAFEGDQPAIEGGCDVTTGNGCAIIPSTDDSAAANFYPFYSTSTVGGQCVWQWGNHIPGSTNDFGQDNQYGALFPSSHLISGGGGASRSLLLDFRQIMSKNPCPA